MPAQFLHRGRSWQRGGAPGTVCLARCRPWRRGNGEVGAELKGAGLETYVHTKARKSSAWAATRTHAVRRREPGGERRLGSASVAETWRRADEGEAWRRRSFRIVAMLAEENAGCFRCVERRSTGHRHRGRAGRVALQLACSKAAARKQERKVAAVVGSR
jgi:hypothetical protein